MRGVKQYRKLRRNDLLGFDRDAVALILEAIAAGCDGKVSNRGHCILRNNTGGTTAIPKNLKTVNRGAKNARAQINRLIAGQRPKTEQETRR